MEAQVVKPLGIEADYSINEVHTKLEFTPEIREPTIKHASEAEINQLRL